MTKRIWSDAVQSCLSGEETTLRGKQVYVKRNMVLSLPVNKHGIVQIVEHIRDIQPLYPSPRELEELLSNGATTLHVGDQESQYIHLSSTGPIHSFFLDEDVATIYMGSVDMVLGLPAHLAHIACLLQWNVDKKPVDTAVFHIRKAYVQCKDLKLVSSYH